MHASDKPGDDREDRVGAVRGRLHDLVARAQEILAQDRQRRRAARDVDVREVAEEMIALGQHADRVGTRLLVLARDRGGIEMRHDEPHRRRRALDLGDDRRPGEPPRAPHENRGARNAAVRRARAMRPAARAPRRRRAPRLWQRRAWRACPSYRDSLVIAFERAARRAPPAHGRSRPTCARAPSRRERRPPRPRRRARAQR